MSLKIEIELPDDAVTSRNLAAHIDALAHWSVDHVTERGAPVASRPVVAATPESETVERKPAQDEAVAEPAAETAIDHRPVGAPAEGNKRRNSAEKAEDDEIEALAETKGVPLDVMNAAIAKAGRAEAVHQLRARDDAAASKGEKPAISTGEERIGPEDTPEVQAQDAADEAAESAATETPAIERLRKAVGLYAKKHGMPAATALFGTGGLIGVGMDEIAEEDLPAAIEAVEKAAQDEAPAAVKPATRDDLVTAMKRYALKFDGQDTDMAKMPATMADMPKLFVELFGAGVEKLSQVPAEGYAKAIAAIDDAIETDKFGRDNG